MPAGLASLLRDSDAKCLVSQRSMLPTLEAIRGDLAPLLPGRVLLIDGAAGDFGDYGLSHRPTMKRSPRSPAVPTTSSTSCTRAERLAFQGHHAQPLRALDVLLADGFRVSNAPESRTLHAGAIVFNGAYVTLMPTFYLGGTYVC